jgi:hypothetical protein
MSALLEAINRATVGIRNKLGCMQQQYAIPHPAIILKLLRKKCSLTQEIWYSGILKHIHKL